MSAIILGASCRKNMKFNLSFEKTLNVNITLDNITFRGVLYEKYEIGWARKKDLEILYMTNISDQNGNDIF